MVWHLTLDRHPERVLPTYTNLLTDPMSRRALAHRDIAAVYRILRDAGVTQASIALATGQKQSEVSEIIAGRQVQSVVLLERIADGLGVPRGWVGLAYEPDPGPVGQQDPQTGDLSDANLLRHAITVLRGKPVLGPADPIRVRNVPTPVPRRVGPTDIAQVAATTQRLGRLTSDVGGIPITSALTAHPWAREALWGATMSEAVREQLLIALSDAHRAAGHAAASAGLRNLAQQHYVRGMDCAAEAGDMLRAVVALDYLGGLELDVGQPNEALSCSSSAPQPRAALLLASGWNMAAPTHSACSGRPGRPSLRCAGPRTATMRPMANPCRGATSPLPHHIRRVARTLPWAVSTEPREPCPPRRTG